MQRNIYNDDFERLIRQKADQYKMYPSDQVWKGVYKSLHGRKRWRWAGLAILLLGIGIYSGNWYFSDKPAARLAQNIEPSISAANNFQQAPTATSTVPFRWITSNRTASNTTVNRIDVRINGGSQDNISTAQQQLATNDIAGRRSNPNNESSGFSKENAFVIINNDFISNDERLNIIADKEDIATTKALANKSSEEKTEKSLSTFADASSESALNPNKEQTGGVNWLQDYAVFQLTPAKPKRLGLQLHFSPTVNYRKLSGKSYYPSAELKSVPLALNIVGDVDQFVKHKPALGFEIGSSVLYRYSKHVTLKAGVQFNYSRYQIEAYSSMPEIATIALNNQTFINDTVSSYSRIRNFSGYAEEDLFNQYFQISLPVGLEYKVIGSGKLELHVAGTIQPTYLVNKNSYLITTDFKNYMREPSLVRRWNVNGGLEAYVSYHTGSVRWQVGPQFRYQLLSTYSRKYPIKEQLMEYGVKVGVSRTLR